MRRLIVAAACLLAAQLAWAAAPSKAKVHGFALSGTVASVDDANKTLVVRGASGRQTTLIWTSATSVVGGRLAAGQSVTLRYLDRDGKHVATSIHISPPPSPRTASTPAPTPTSGS
jgi:hypothetical protein